MDSQTDAETDRHSLPVLPVILLSDDSDEDSSQEEVPATNWNELSIIERVGLNSVEMSETDLEAAFTQIAVAFRCDQYTLKQRLQAEEHARNLAEENVQLELSRGRETLEVQTLKGLCLDSKRSRILQRLELSLDILAGTVERISNTAEVLGAVHQEARVSRAVELMVAHVENVRKRHDRQEVELDEAKKTIVQQNSSRMASDARASPDPDDGDRKKSSLQHCRRRVSISLIPTPIQEKLKRDFKRPEASCPTPAVSSESGCSAVAKDDGGVADDRPPDPEETPPEAPAAQPPPEPPPAPPNPESAPTKPAAPRKMPHKSSPLDTLRQRHKSKAALSKKKADKDRKSANVYQQISPGPRGSLWRQRPAAHWLYRCRWALLGVYLLILLCVVMLTYFLWNLHDDDEDDAFRPGSV